MGAEHPIRSVMNADDVSRSLTRIAHEIVERNQGIEGLMLLGIQTRGVPLARRLAGIISRAYNDAPIEWGSLDITMYRDDLASQPTRAPQPSDVPNGSIDNCIVVLVDDVFYSGRTIRAAFEALGPYGRPSSVQLAVLVDRGHRRLPIRADFVGKNLPTSLSERVTVSLAEIDGEDSVAIEVAA